MHVHIKKTNKIILGPKYNSSRLVGAIGHHSNNILLDEKTYEPCIFQSKSMKIAFLWGFGEKKVETGKVTRQSLNLIGRIKKEARPLLLNITSKSATWVF